MEEMDSWPYTSVDTGMPGDVESIYRVSDDTLYASGGVPGNGWILRSTVNGYTWEAVAGPFLNPLNSIFFTNAANGYVADADVLIFRTNDQAQSWNQFYPNQWPLNVNRNLRDIYFTDATHGYICGGKNFGNGLIYRTTDGGATWSFSEFNHELRAVRFQTPSEGIVVGYGACLETNDGGISWNIGDGEGLYFMDAEVMKGKLYRVTLDGRVEVRETPTAPWNRIREKSSHMHTSSKAFCIGISDQEDIVLGGLDGFVSVRRYGETSWKDYRTFDGTSVHDIEFTKDGQIIAAGENGKIFRMNLP